MKNRFRWYEWPGGNPVGQPRIKEYIVAFYENNSCYDEIHYKPNEVINVVSFLMEENCKIFVVFSESEVYELKLNPAN